jgi:hypothetical protein
MSRKIVNKGIYNEHQNINGGTAYNIVGDINTTQNKKKSKSRTDATQEARSSIIKALIVGGVIIFIFELLIYRLPWTWLITQPSSYGLQLAIDVLLLLLVSAIFLVEWRKYIIGSMLIPIFGFLLTLLKESNKP